MFPRNRRLYVKLLKFTCLFLTILFLLDFFGVFLHIFEVKFEKFEYELNGNINAICYKVRKGEKPDVEPINNAVYTYRHNNENKCKDELQKGLVPHLLIIVKSRNDHFERRNAIRNSWGFEKRFSDVIIRTVFSLGIDQQTHNDQLSEIQKLVDIESERYKDIIQFNFIDEYYNNTLKTMHGMKWCKENCIRSKFYLFVDDDYYVSIKNILAFLRNPVNYPEYLEAYKEQLRKLNQRKLQEAKIINGTNHTEMTNRNLLSFNVELPPNVKLFAGYVFNSRPHRHRSSKWYISLDEYKYDRWPTYVTAGCFLLSREALQEMFCTSQYTKYFRFDDIFLGIVALKANIEPLHSEEFYYYKAAYSGPASYRYVLATHGYDNSDEMLKVWNEVRASGYA
ncbi:beta-1,3-galactosyltransferase brn [Chironomus tepperi]|uniref:beta-1,3-galactosyltransferase brn n=1 Tax=Chironomus tepperi TaxID=113505 RepID=UPI00391F6E4B